MGRDLGTYWLRVKFEDESGYLQRWDTGRRYTDGSRDLSPLPAQPIWPPWENERELLAAMEYQYINGNYSCDCNRMAFILEAREGHTESRYFSCGENIRLKQLVAIGPDGIEIVIWEDGKRPG